MISISSGSSNAFITFPTKSGGNRNRTKLYHNESLGHITKEDSRLVLLYVWNYERQVIFCVGCMEMGVHLFPTFWMWRKQNTKKKGKKRQKFWKKKNELNHRSRIRKEVKCPNQEYNLFHKLCSLEVYLYCTVLRHYPITLLLYAPLRNGYVRMFQRQEINKDSNTTPLRFEISL